MSCCLSCLPYTGFPWNQRPVPSYKPTGPALLISFISLPFNQAPVSVCSLIPPFASYHPGLHSFALDIRVLSRRPLAPYKYRLVSAGLTLKHHATRFHHSFLQSLLQSLLSQHLTFSPGAGQPSLLRPRTVVAARSSQNEIHLLSSFRLGFGQRPQPVLDFVRQR